MSAPVHYDVEKLIADLRSGCAGIQLGPDAKPYELIALQHREAFIRLVEMTLTAENEGHSTVDVFIAGEMLIGDWLKFMLQSYDDVSREHALETFLYRLHRLVETLHANAPDTRVYIRSSVGGHA